MKIITKRGEKTLFINIILILLFFPEASRAFKNPHNNINNCLLCHSKKPEVSNVLERKIFLIDDDYEKKCISCHVSTQHETVNHPIGILPREKTNLPLKNGFITCTTCHYCNDIDKDFGSYMLRLPISYKTIEERKANMCRKCHIGY